MMAMKRILSQDQEALADALFPAEVDDDFEEAILSIPPERRILRTEQYDFAVSTLVSNFNGVTYGVIDKLHGSSNP
jgi:hypothetical protein